MADPFASVKSIDAAALAELTDLSTIADEFEEPFDDAPDFDSSEDPEVDVNIRLRSDRSHLRQPCRRLFIDYRPNPDALLHLKTLPREGESLHGVISGKYAAFDLIPAMIARTNRKISELYIATLSYSRQNAADMIGLLDTRQVRRVSLLVSYFFKAQNRELYDTLVPLLRDRGHRVLAMRTHAKLLLMKFAGGGSYVWEGSANLRSCKNYEQFVLTRCRKLYRFHQTILEDDLLNRRAEGSEE